MTTRAEKVVSVPDSARVGSLCNGCCQCGGVEPLQLVASFVVEKREDR